MSSSSSSAAPKKLHVWVLADSSSATVSDMKANATGDVTFTLIDPSSTTRADITAETPFIVLVDSAGKGAVKVAAIEGLCVTYLNYDNAIPDGMNLVGDAYRYRTTAETTAQGNIHFARQATHHFGCALEFEKTLEEIQKINRENDFDAAAIRRAFVDSKSPPVLGGLVGLLQAKLGMLADKLKGTAANLERTQ